MVLVMPNNATCMLFFIIDFTCMAPLSTKCTFHIVSSIHIVCVLSMTSTWSQSTGCRSICILNMMASVRHYNIYMHFTTQKTISMSLSTVFLVMFCDLCEYNFQHWLNHIPIGSSLFIKFRVCKRILICSLKLQALFFRKLMFLAQPIGYRSLKYLQQLGECNYFFKYIPISPTQFSKRWLSSSSLYSEE